MLDGVQAIYYRETQILRRRLIKTILTSAVSPLLFLVAFGFGVGRETEVNGVSYLVFLLPGLLTMSSMNQSYAIATEINIARFYLKTFEEYILAPIPRWEIIIGEVLYGMTRGLVPVAVIFCYSLIFDIDLNLQLFFIPALLLHLACFSLIGFIAAMLMRSHSDQAMVSAFMITPMMFLSGTFFPVEQMPAFVQGIAALSPLTYSTELIRAAMLGTAEPVADLFLRLVIMPVALFFIALAIVKKAKI